MYASQCGDDSKNKLRGLSEPQSKHIKFEEHEICLDGKEYQRECNTYFIRSINHKLHLQEVKKIYIIYFR